MSEKAFTDEQAVALMERHQNGESMRALAQEYGRGWQTLRRAFLRNGYEPRGRGRPPILRTPELVSEIVAAYESGASQKTIADRVGIDQSQISRMLRMEGVAMRSRGAWQTGGENHHAWRGGRVTVNGYVNVLVQPENVYASMANSVGYVPEHRLVMARHLERTLTKDETVHHINGDKTDNRLENLQLRTGRHGKNAAFICADCGSINVVPTKLL